MPGTYHKELAESAIPVVHPPRKVPVPQREKFIEELKRMEKLGVIVRQEEPTEWVNSLVVAQKPVASRLQGASTFSILDANSGF